MTYEDIKEGDVVWLLPLEDIKDVNDVGPLWVDEMDVYAGTPVVVDRKFPAYFTIDLDRWSVNSAYIDYEKTSQVVTASQFDEPGVNNYTGECVNACGQAESELYVSTHVQSIKMEPESALPEGVDVFDAKYTFTQEPDGEDSGIIQTLSVDIVDSAGPKYLVISTDRWAINNVEELTKLLEKVKNSFIALGGKF